MPLLTTDAPKAIAMWDFSWLERRWEGGGYDDWARALDELVERGYDAVRIDAFPHLVAADPDAEYTLVPVWDQHDWGSPAEVVVRIRPALTEFIALAAERNVAVALSSWFRKDTRDVRMQLTTPDELAGAWASTLDLIDEAGLLGSVWFVDLGNEWPNAMWAPFLYPYAGGADARVEPRTSPRIEQWTQRALHSLQDRYPAMPLCFSFSEYDFPATEDVLGFGLLEPHAWMAQEEFSGFYAEAGYALTDSLFDPEPYAVLARTAGPLYAADPDRWRQLLTAKIAGLADWSRATGLPLVTTECWAIINWKDGPGLEWGWLKEVCEHGVRAAIATGQWVGLATSNFCGPQFRGMWGDVAWHRALTDQIKGS